MRVKSESDRGSFAGPLRVASERSWCHLKTKPMRGAFSTSWLSVNGAHLPGPVSTSLWCIFRVQFSRLQDSLLRAATRWHPAGRRRWGNRSQAPWSNSDPARSKSSERPAGRASARDARVETETRSLQKWDLGWKRNGKRPDCEKQHLLASMLLKYMKIREQKDFLDNVCLTCLIRVNACVGATCLVREDLPHLKWTLRHTLTPHTCKGCFEHMSLSKLLLWCC